MPDAPTLIVTTEHTAQTEFQRVKKFNSAGVEVLAVPPKDEHCDLTAVLAELGRRGIQQLLVEAGPTLISRFLAEHLADELHIFIAPLLLGQNGTADITAPLSALLNRHKLKNPRIEILEDDIYISGYL